MKIAVIAPFEERVPPEKYGGTELVIYNIIENLVSMGHKVTLFASGDSQTSSELKPVFPNALRSMSEMSNARYRDSYKFIGVGRIVKYLHENRFDIIHNHLGWRLLPFEKIINSPIVTTLHGPLDVDYMRAVYGEFKKSKYVSISENQRKPMPELNYVGTVYNGIQIGKFKFNETPGNYFVFLGRMSPEKGPVQAIEIAKRARVELIMAAKVDIVDKEYFKSEIEPLIDNKQIKYIGEVNHAEKVNLLGGAKALVAPIQWEEPFGLFFVEAMACGTPVITTRRGSVPEIIVDGKTGFVCDSLDEAVRRINDIDEIDRKDCCQHVKENFSAEKMTKDYVEIYEKVING